ncbi:MAG TPA: KEOPS complex subunit Pcc1 [Nitrososphaera sp.]|jgi:hypothetical protein
MIQSLRPPDISISIDIKFPRQSQAAAALNALIPDNVNFPKGLSVKMSARNSVLSIQAHSKKVPVSTMVSTLDEILEHISVAKKVMPE